MKSIEFSIIIYFVIFYLAPIQSFIELPRVGFNALSTTEDVVRNTTGKIFLVLKLRNTKNKPRIKQLTMIHNVFAMITLRGQKTLKHIARLARVTLNNTTKHFIAQINEVLDGDDKKSNENDLIEHTEGFLEKLSDLKEKFGFNDKIHQLNINPEILTFLNKKTNDKLNNTSDGDESEENFLSDDEFWRAELTKTRRIFQGSRTTVKKFPFMASVQFFNRFHCGGSIIKSDLVITAASCLQLAWNNRFFRSNPAFLSVRVGSDYHNVAGENIPVLNINFHPMYNTKTLRNNLAILRLVRRINFKKRSKRVKKINIDKSPWPLPVTIPGITVLGWGATTSRNIPKNTLTFDTLDVYSLKDCQEIYSKDYVTQTNFCAGFIVKGGGACNHDVGGPGISDGLLVGVMSFGSPICGHPDSPTVFTKLGFYNDWIEEIMEQPTLVIDKRTTLKASPRILTTPPASTPFTVTPYLPFTDTTYLPEPSISDCDVPPSSKFDVPPSSKCDVPSSSECDEPPSSDCDVLRARTENPKKTSSLSSLMNSQTLKALFQEFIGTLFASYEFDDPSVDKKYQTLLKMVERSNPLGNEKGGLRTINENETTDEPDVTVDSEEETKEVREHLVTVMQDFDPTPTTVDSSLEFRAIYESITRVYAANESSAKSFQRKPARPNRIFNFDDIQNVGSESSSEERLKSDNSGNVLLRGIETTTKQMKARSESYLYLPNDTNNILHTEGKHINLDDVIRTSLQNIQNNKYTEIVDILLHANDASNKGQEEAKVDEDDIFIKNNDKLASVEIEIGLEKLANRNKDEIDAKEKTEEGLGLPELNPKYRAFSDPNVNKDVGVTPHKRFKFDWLNELIDDAAA